LTTATLITTPATPASTGAGVELLINSAPSSLTLRDALPILGATLDLDSLTVTNTGTVLVDATAGSTLDLESAIIAGGTVTNHGLDGANTGLTNSNHNATQIANGGTLEATGAGVELQIKSATT